MTTILTGNKPLWPTLAQYIIWLSRHHDDIYARYLGGDENADLIIAITTEKDVARDTVAAAALKVATERYIATYHRDIAVIADGAAS